MNNYFNKNKLIVIVILWGIGVFFLYKDRDTKYPFNKSKNITVDKYEVTRNYLTNLCEIYHIDYKDLNNWIKNHSDYMLTDDVELVLKEMSNNNMKFNQTNFNIVSDRILLDSLDVSKNEVEIKRKSYGF